MAKFQELGTSYTLKLMGKQHRLRSYRADDGSPLERGYNVMSKNTGSAFLAVQAPFISSSELLVARGPGAASAPTLDI